MAEILKCKFLNIAGKKVYVFPAYEELLCENPQLGEPEPVAVEVKEVAIDVNNRLILSNQSWFYSIGTTNQEKENGCSKRRW